MIIFVHFYFPFSVHCYIIIYTKQYSQDDNIEDVIEVNGVKFYYNPNEINANDYIETLRLFSPEDTAYTLYLDEKQGLVIF